MADLESYKKGAYIYDAIRKSFRNLNSDESDKLYKKWLDGAYYHGADGEVAKKIMLQITKKLTDFNISLPLGKKLLEVNRNSEEKKIVDKLLGR